MEEFEEYREKENDASESSEQESWAVTWNLESFDEDTESINDESVESSVLVEKYKDLDNQYKAAKSDIDFSNTKEEQSFWANRAEQLYKEREEIDNKNNKNN